MASIVTRSQCIRAPFGCGGTGDLHYGCATNLKQLCDAVTTIWSQMSEECLQQLVELKP